MADGMFVVLMQKYKYRLIVDEALSIGVLGPKGRGACEHFGYAPSDVEFVGGSLGERVVVVRASHGQRTVFRRDFLHRHLR